jgi:hypothetical protein
MASWRPVAITHAPVRHYENRLALPFDEDDLVVDEQGKIVAYTIEDAAGRY